MASRDSGTVRPAKRKRVFLAAAVLLLVCVLAAGAVSAEMTICVYTADEFKERLGSLSEDTTIVVMGDITLDFFAYPLQEHNLTLTTKKDKNHTISWGSDNPTLYLFGMFDVESGKHLTITGNGTGTLTLKGKSNGPQTLKTLIMIEDTGYFTLGDGGILANNTATNYGGAVYMKGGTFTMKGGTIANNTATDAMTGGGAVYMTGGTFTMSGGTIANNTATNHGGAVYMTGGTFTMEGGTIANNTATSGFGGALSVDGNNNAVDITLSGTAKISNNTATNGGGVFMKGLYTRITLSGTAEISNNKAVEGSGGLDTGHGGGVHVDDGIFSIEDSATITGNEAKKNGGGVYVHSDGTFEMSGGTITGNTATSNGNGVYVGSIFNLKGNGMVDSVYLPYGKNITVIDLLTGTETQVTGIIPEKPEEDLLVVDLANAPDGDYLSMFDLDDSVENFALTDVPNEQKQGLVLTPIYTVTFKANGGTPVSSQMKVVSGNTVEEPETKREGYTLEGWYNGTKKWDFTQDVVDEDITLTANWTRNTYTVTFEANGGSEVQPRTVNHGETVNKPDDPVRDRHTFAGWHKDTTCTQPWNFDTDTVTSDLILHAKWTPNKPVPPSGGVSSDGNMDNAYRVLFNDGATTLYIVTDLSAGDKLTKPEDPVKDGYTFAGWHKDTACTQAWDFNDGITGDMTLYAKWTPQETVTPTATATPTVTATATATQTAEPTGNASPAPTVQPDTNDNNGDNTNGETTATSGISLPYLIGGILILLLAILLLLILLLRHTVTFLIPTGGELEEYRIKVWHGRYINTEDLPDLIRTAAWYRDPARQERWDFNEDRVTKSIELYIG